MARSLGDQAVKPIGVIANPEVVERDIDLKKDRFVILASDGVWEFLSSEEVVCLIEASFGGGGGGGSNPGISYITVEDSIFNYKSTGGPCSWRTQASICCL